MDVIGRERVGILAIIKAVLWDMDGVLVDSERMVRDIFVELMEQDNIVDDPRDLYQRSIGLNKASIIELYLQYMDSVETAEYYYRKVGDLYKEKLATDLQMKRGVVEALQAVQTQSLPQMVVTSTETESAWRKIKLFGLETYFDDLIGGDQVSKGKPNPEPYLTACSKLGVEPANALVIEDSPNGVKAGLAAGCAVIHVPDLIDTDPSWQDEIYDALDTLESFPAWFEAQRGGDWL